MELSEFFKNPLNSISIWSEDDHLLKVFQPEHLEDFRGRFLFIENFTDPEDKTEKYRFVKLDKDTVFTVHGKDIDLMKIYKTISITFLEWKKLYPNIPFPAIRITSDVSLDGYLKTASIWLDKEKNQDHTIYLPISELQNIDHLKYCIGHELGHLIYYKNFQTITENHILDQEKKSAFYLKEMIPYETIILTIIISTVLLFSFLNHENNYTLSERFSVVSLFIVLTLVASILTFSLLTRKTRYLNYSSEYFCDYFAMWFYHNVDPINTKNLILYASHNVFSHPASHLRRHVLNNFKYQSLDKWKSPISELSFFHRNSKIPEIKGFLKIYQKPKKQK